MQEHRHLPQRRGNHILLQQLSLATAESFFYFEVDYRGVYENHIY